MIRITGITTKQGKNFNFCEVAKLRKLNNCRSILDALPFRNSGRHQGIASTLKVHVENHADRDNIPQKVGVASLPLRTSINF